MGIKILKALLSILKFIINNVLYVAWFLIYFIMTTEILSLWIPNKSISYFVTIIGYLISFIIVFSPIGEYILRFITGVRKLYTEQEIEYLNPIFYDVYFEARKLYPRLSKKIKLCLIDAMYINAFALGRRTAAVTTGAVEALTEDELKGLIAHELAHLYNGDTKALMFITVGNGLLSLFTIALQKILYLLETEFYVQGFLWWIVKTLIRILLLYFAYLAQVTLSINSRWNEYKADKFAYKTGYGDNLKEALYLLQKLCISDKSRFVEKLAKSHPNMAKRIGKLEKMINAE